RGHQGPPPPDALTHPHPSDVTSPGPAGHLRLLAGGERGIRTHGGPQRPQRFSRPSHSSALAALRRRRYRVGSRRCEKEDVSSAAASAARTPWVTATSWCSLGSAPRL